MPNKKENNLNSLEELEKSQKGIGYNQDMGNVNDDKTEEVKTEEPQRGIKITNVEQPSTTDGYRVLPNSEFSQGGRLYPASWRFAYRCPKSNEVANFSTVNENDQPAIFAAVEDLICKCFKIVDIDTETIISPKEINDGDRLFCILKLREFYLPESYISYSTICPFCKGHVEVRLLASTLRYPQITEKMMSFFDGRRFTIPASVMDTTTDIVFYIPTLKTAAKIFHYLLKIYRDNESDNKQDEEAFTKQFLFIAPFLFETGNETMNDIKVKFRKICKDENLLNAYTVLASKMVFSNKQEIVYSHDCGSEEEAAIRFPGGWKNMFIDTRRYMGLFE